MNLQVSCLRCRMSRQPMVFAVEFIPMIPNVKAVYRTFGLLAIMYLGPCRLCSHFFYVLPTTFSSSQLKHHVTVSIIFFVTDIHSMLTVNFIRIGLAKIIYFVDWRKLIDILVAIWFEESGRAHQILFVCMLWQNRKYFLEC